MKAVATAALIAIAGAAWYVAITWAPVQPAAPWQLVSLARADGLSFRTQKTCEVIRQWLIKNEVPANALTCVQ